MKPEPGTEVELVAPPEPTEAVEAGNATAGQVESVSREAAQKSTAELSSTEVGDNAADDSSDSQSSESAEEKQHEPDKEKKGWIEIVLKDEDGTPLGGARYKVTLPDGSVADGTLDGKGKARVDGFDSGQCKIEFSDLDEKVWS